MDSTLALSPALTAVRYSVIRSWTAVMSSAVPGAVFTVRMGEALCVVVSLFDEVDSHTAAPTAQSATSTPAPMRTPRERDFGDCDAGVTAGSNGEVCELC